MKTVLLPELSGSAKNSLHRLDARKTQHIRKVLRMEWGESLLVTNGMGMLFKAQLEKSGDTAAVLIEELLREEKVFPETVLFIGLAKNNTMDWLVEKAVECGVTKIVPVVTSRSVVRPNQKDLGKYSERWQAIMDGAVEQSERLWRPTVESPIAWKELVNHLRQGSLRICFQSELHTELDAKTLKGFGDQPIEVFIGPEGGFSEEERNEFGMLDFTALSLGSTVLRVETAVIAALFLIKLGRVL